MVDLFQKKAMLFDFDGVVVNSEQIYEEYTREQFLHYGIQIPPSDWSLFKGISTDVFFKLIKHRYLPDVDIRELEEAWQVGLRKKIREKLAYTPYFCHFYEKIHPYFKTALVTSSRRSMIEWIFQNTIIENVFSLIITSDDVKNTKPHAEPYVTAAQKLGVPIEQCIVIEDSIRGITSGKKSGAFIIAITTSHSREELKDADLIIDSWNELSLEKLWML
ncbi:MAG: HAD family phosphatase [Candidatus Marinimicrobia bacterium]|nr:HAD family phosphatase [Candidatus Neomarinimicrobiota bacterium]MDD5582936.1 HAD family phosphatase [Candidatus Neomarinimicrobiota bacterium]